MPRTSLLWKMALVVAIAVVAVAVKWSRSDLRLAEMKAPPADTHSMDNRPPAESKPGGTRPTTPAPEPARPEQNSPAREAPAALPPAPAEKTAPPIREK